MKDVEGLVRYLLALENVRSVIVLPPLTNMSDYDVFIVLSKLNPATIIHAKRFAKKYGVENVGTIPPWIKRLPPIVGESIQKGGIVSGYPVQMEYVTANYWDKFLYLLNRLRDLRNAPGVEERRHIISKINDINLPSRKWGFRETLLYLLSYAPSWFWYNFGRFLGLLRCIV